MSRPTGSKNKPKTTEQLIAELTARGALPAAAQTPAHPIEKTAQPTEPTPATGTKREKFALTLNTPESKQGNTQTYRCGNTLCNKLLESELPSCPHCGAKLAWS